MQICRQCRRCKRNERGIDAIGYISVKTRITKIAGTRAKMLAAKDENKSATVVEVLMRVVGGAVSYLLMAVLSPTIILEWIK